MNQCAIESVGRIEYWLIEWARWIRAYRVDLGYPHKAAVMLSGGESRRGEDAYLDQENEAWSVNVKALDSLIEGLQPSQRCAIRATYLGEPWRFPRANLDHLLALAEGELMIGCDARGVCI